MCATIPNDSRDQKKKKRQKVLIILLIVVFVFESAIHYNVAKIFIGGVEHKGVEIYESGTYLKYPKGKLFQQHLQSLELPEECQAVDFYFINNWPLDTLIYGKICDVYSVDLQMGEHYDKLKEQIQNNATGLEEYWDNMLYHLSEDAFGVKDYFLVYTNDQTREMRFILVTDHYRKTTSFLSLFFNLTTLEW